jgi:uncharacterized membrane protein HdeD (DUF308 family)
VFGAYALLDGVFGIFAAFGRKSSRSTLDVQGARQLANGGREAVWYVLEGILGIAVGIATFFYPNITAQALIYLVGFWAIMTGIFEIVAGFELPLGRDWLLALAGVVSVVFGVLVFFNPGAGAVAVVWLIGIYAVLFGITMLVFGIRLRGLHNQLVAKTA